MFLMVLSTGAFFEVSAWMGWILQPLTDSELADIGISREQADAEANSPMRFRF
jgi:hypothetical protein